MGYLGSVLRAQFVLSLDVLVVGSDELVFILLVLLGQQDVLEFEVLVVVLEFGDVPLHYEL